MSNKKLLIGLCLVFLTTLGFAQTGTVKGVVFEDANNEPLIGATVAVLDASTGNVVTGIITDFDGNFTLPNVPAGVYNVQCSFVSFETILRENVEVKGGQETVLEFRLKEASVAISGVEVTARANRESEAILMLEQRKADVIKESIGAKRLSELGVSDAATATTKISGVTKNEGSGDVYVRGLGDRYLSTTMNGLPIPSDDIEKKNIDLNLFSTDVINNVGISKTYSVSGYADQTSGAIDITSKTFSDKISIGLSGGVNTEVLPEMSSFRATQNIDAVSLGFFSENYELEEVINQKSWNTLENKTPINYGFSLLAGKEVKLFGKELSVFGTLGHSSSSEYRFGSYKKFRSNYANEIFEDAEEYITKWNTTGLLNLEYKINPRHTIKINNLLISKTSDGLYEAGRNKDGYYFEQTNSAEKDSSIFVRDQNIKRTNLFINQILGNHEVGDKNTLNWGASYNVVNADEPNRIRNKVTILDDNTAEFVWVGGFDQRKSYQNINDKEANAYIANEFRLIDEETKKIKLNFGANFRYKTRDFTANAIGVDINNRNLVVPGIDDMDAILLDQSLYANNDLDFNNLPVDSYTGDLLVFGGFADIRWELKKFSGSVGVRYETDILDVNWDVTNYLGRLGDVKYEYNNVLPSLNLKYQLNEKNAMRVAASQTVTLPEFKELAPFEYVSPEGRVTKGNEDLVMSENYNFDLKWEIFPSAKEMFSATAFYKIINDPINKSQTRGSAGTFFFTNIGDQANVYGFELEGRYYIIEAQSTEEPELKMSANFTRMWHEQDLLEEFQYNNKTTSGLQGASEFIFNGSLTFSNNKENELTATVAANYSSDKIFALGVPEDFANSDKFYNSEIVEVGFVTLDMILTKELNERITIKLSGKNLLDPKIEQSQQVTPSNTGISRTESVRSYHKGRAISLGISINLN